MLYYFSQFKYIFSLLSKYAQVSIRVFTFGLLMSSLVMLAIIPFLNQQQNNFLNTAMAQGYRDNYNYGDSYYSHYPTDDKKYECRTGPFEGLFVSL